MSRIKQQLLCLEEDFLSALGAGDQAMTAFEHRWQKLLDDIDDNAASPDFDPDLSALVHTTALRIATLAETSVALFTSYDSLTGELIGELDGLMAELSLSDVSSGILSSSYPNAEYADPVLRTSVESSPSPSRKRRRRSFDHGEESIVPKRRCSSRTAKALYPPSDNHRNQPSFPCATTSTSRTLASSIAPAHASTPRSSKRKRRLSESDSLATSNLPKRLHVGPRLSAVSGSFLNPYTVTWVPSPSIDAVDPVVLLPGTNVDYSTIQAPAPLVPAIPTLTIDTTIEQLDHIDPFTSSLDCSPRNDFSVHMEPSAPCTNPLDSILTQDGFDHFLATLFHPCGQPVTPPPCGLDISTFEFTDHTFGDASSPTSTTSSPATSPYPLTPPPAHNLALGPAFYEFQVSDLEASWEDGSFLPAFGNDIPTSLVSFGEENGLIKDSILGFPSTVPQQGVVSEWDALSHLPDPLSALPPPKASFVSI